MFLIPYIHFNSIFISIPTEGMALHGMEDLLAKQNKSLYAKTLCTPMLLQRTNKIVASWIFQQDGLMFNSIAIRTFTNNIQSMLVVVCANANSWNKWYPLNRIQFNSRVKSKYLKEVEKKNQHPIRRNDKREIKCNRG